MQHVVDDMFLTTELYSPTGSEYLIGSKDLAQHITWMATVNSKLPAGSDYFVEVGHNGNGNIEVGTFIPSFISFLTFYKGRRKYHERRETMWNWTD